MNNEDKHINTKNLQEIASELNIDMDYFTDWASDFCNDSDLVWLDENE